MNFKESRTNHFMQKEKYSSKIQKSAQQLLEKYPTLYSYREAIQIVKENFRSGSCVEVGRVFQGNSNKCYIHMHEKIPNRVQKRNQLKKNQKHLIDYMFIIDMKSNSNLLDLLRNKIFYLISTQN